MNVKIKLCENGKLPMYAHSGDACMDCYAAEGLIINPGEVKKVRLGFCLELPAMYEAQIRPRSGLSVSGILGVLGTVDSNYRGEVCAIIHNCTQSDFVIKFGDRICQMKIEKVEPIVLEEVEFLSESNRQCNGFGSSGI